MCTTVHIGTFLGNKNGLTKSDILSLKFYLMLFLRKTIFLSSILVFLILSKPVFCQTSITETNPFTFNLSSSASTSAGVFKTDGTLVRTLWSAVNFNAGEHTENWDGLLDDGSPAMVGTYQIKVLSNNVIMMGWRFYR